MKEEMSVLENLKPNKLTSEGEQGCPKDAMVGLRLWGLAARDSVLPRLVRCLFGFLDEQPCCRLLIIVKCTEVCGGGGVDDLRQTRLQEVLRKKACQDCVTDHAKHSRLGCDEGSEMSQGCDVSRSLEPDS